MPRPLLWLLLLAGSIGCSGPGGRLPPLAWPDDLAPVSSDLTVLRAVIHVHSVASHDSDGSLEEIFAAARRTGVDVVVLTDHGARAFAAEQGERDGVLLLVGEEQSTQGGTHLLGIGHSADLPGGLPPGEAAAALDADGGLSVTAHPVRKPRPDVAEAVASTDLMEVYSLSTDALARGSKARMLFYGLWHHVNYERTLDEIVRPPREAMALWDEQLARRACVGIGAVDAHGTYGFSYAAAFRVVQTHVLARERSPAGVVEALRAGRCYVTFERLAPVPFFAFRVLGPEGPTPMGGETSWSADLEARVVLPQAARVVLKRDGEALAEAVGADERFPLPGPGVYRVEAWLGDRLWIFSNAVRVLAP